MSPPAKVDKAIYRSIDFRSIDGFRCNLWFFGPRIYVTSSIRQLPVSGTTLIEQMFDHLRGEILGGRLLPGQTIKVSEISSKHEVSLNVVREALNRLTGEGFVISAPHIGFTVRPLSMDDVADLVKVRISVETLALTWAIRHGDVAWESRVLAAHHRLANTRRTHNGLANEDWIAAHREFHRSILEGCASQRLMGIIQKLADNAQIYHRALVPTLGDKRPVEEEHQRLMQAVIVRDVDRSLTLLTDHLERTLEDMRPLIK